MRKLKDMTLQALTYGSSFISVLVLISILYFVFHNGWSSLSMKLLTGNYWAENYVCEMSQPEPGFFLRPEHLSEEAAWSSKWGIALIDGVNEHKDHVILLEYIDAHSPFADLYTTDVHQRKLSAEPGFLMENLTLLDEAGNKSYAGNIVKQDAMAMAEALDQAEAIPSMYFKTAGGGIAGSIKATLMLIAVALLLALPIGISAAIYLTEYASQSRWNSLLRSMIEMLSGVPSIIFSLMGVSVLYPITAMLGAQTTSILLGGMTLSIILLPIVIRSTEEALLVVPKGLRDASLSLGATRTQTIFKVVLPCALPGILSAILLSIGRVVGESAALIYTMGTYVNDTPQLLGQGTSLAVHIYNIMSSEQPNFELACAISIVILVFTLGLNLLVKMVSRRFEKKVS